MHVKSFWHWAQIIYRMLRLRTVLLMVTFEAIGFEAVHPSRIIPFKFLLMALMISALYVCATCFNDVADEEIDKVNLPNDLSRPLVTTAVTAKQLQILGLVALFVALIAAALTGPIFVLFMIMGAGLNIFYSVPPIRMSYRGIFASLWLSSSYVTIPFWTGALIGSAAIPGRIWLLFLGTYSCFVSRILLKDFRDYEGDKKFRKLNFLVRHGPELTCAVSGACWLIGDIILSLYFYRHSLVLVGLMQLLSSIIFYQLYKLSWDKRYQTQLRQVAIVGRMGNAITLAMLTSLTLEAFNYSEVQNYIFIITVGLMVAITAIDIKAS